jgi:hypothetical protein
MYSEDSLQSEIVKWFNNNYCLKHHSPRCCIFSVPNGGFRNKIEAIKMCATGLKAGVSDLIVLLPNRAVFIELKIEKGIQSPVQKDFEQIVTNLGFEYFLVRSLDEFKKIII